MRALLWVCSTLSMVVRASETETRRMQQRKVLYRLERRTGFEDVPANNTATEN